MQSAQVGWGKTFSLHVGELYLDSGAIAGRLPVLGRSGSGKSTLLYLLTCLKRPQKGWVHWQFPDGHKATWGAKGLDRGGSTLNLTQIRRFCFGFAYQNSTLSPYMTVGENLRYPLELMGGIAKKDIEERVFNTMDQLLLRDKNGHRLESTSPEKFMRRMPNELSGGQFQRVALAQAMIHDPYVLFADEPTGNLDGETRQEVMALVDRWLEKGDRLVIWVTHHQSDASSANVRQWLLVTEQRCHLRLRKGAAKPVEMAEHV